ELAGLLEHRIDVATGNGNYCLVCHSRPRSSVWFSAEHSTVSAAVIPNGFGGEKPALGGCPKEEPNGICCSLGESGFLFVSRPRCLGKTCDRYMSLANCRTCLAPSRNSCSGTIKLATRYPSLEKS